ncbi:ABC transporter substrate-binding protein [Tomitella biformata]|uniref:ABC transporter substrate-binding protein n=1 Tax=Tomitella biformata TaxID=630403 RepID=UPI0004AEE0E6|nr:ABC transporter substrate-binding protein [Tomitella biformata]
MAWTLGPTNLDPHQSTNYSVDFNYLSPVYDRLTQAVTGPEVTPMLAESWDFADDGMSVTFHLRDDATFHDGTPVDATAVARSLDRARDPKQARVAGSLSMISAVDAVDPATVKISTNRLAADLPAVLTSTEASIINPLALDGGVDLTVDTAGSGPYIPETIRPGDRITYKRHDGYWDPEAQKPATLEIVGITDDNARLNAFRSGQVDAILVKAGQADDVKTLIAQPKYKLHTFPVGQFYALQLDIGQPGLEDARVRQALNYAVDREGINEGLLNGICEPVTQPLPAGVDGHSEKVDDLYNYDPAKARELLVAANAPSDLTINLTHTAGLSPQQEMATALQAQLGEVGVKVNIMPMASNDAALKFAEGGHSLLNPRLPFPFSSQTLRTNYMVPQRFPTLAPQNFQDLVTASFDPNISDDERTDLYSQASGIAAQDAFDVFLCGVPTQMAYTDDVVGITTAGQGDFVGIVDMRYVGKTS